MQIKSISRAKSKAFTINFKKILNIFKKHLHNEINCDIFIVISNKCEWETPVRIWRFIINY